MPSAVHYCTALAFFGKDDIYQVINTFPETAR
jgi:hypothetical protein